MANYQFITIEDKKSLVQERLLGTEKLIYNLNLDKQSSQEQENDVIDTQISQLTDYINILQKILNDLNNNIDNINQYWYNRKGGKMTINLSPEEKLQIAEQHMKTVLFSEYNAQLSLIEAKAASTPNQSNIDSLNAQAKDIAAQKAALQAEVDAQNAAIAAADSATTAK